MGAKPGSCGDGTDSHPTGVPEALSPGGELVAGSLSPQHGATPSWSTLELHEVVGAKAALVAKLALRWSKMFLPPSFFFFLLFFLFFL